MIGRILPILLVLIAIAAFLMYTKPTFDGPVAEARTTIAGYDSALAAAEQFKKKQAELATARAALPPEGVSRLVALLPDNVNNIQLILDLDALAARSGMELSNFSVSEQSSEDDSAGTQVTVVPNAGMPGGPGPAVMPGGIPGMAALESSNPVDSLEITVTAEGSYASFRTFLEAAEKSLRLLDVVGVTVATSQTGVYTYDITFRIYWLH